MSLPKELKYSIEKPTALTDASKVMHDEMKFTTNSTNDKFSYTGTKIIDIQIKCDGFCDAYEHYLTFKFKNTCSTADDNCFIDGSAHSLFKKVWLSSGTENNICPIDDYHIAVSTMSKLQGDHIKKSIMGKLAGFYNLEEATPTGTTTATAATILSALTITGATLVASTTDPTITTTISEAINPEQTINKDQTRYFRISIMHPFFYSSKYLPVKYFKDVFIHFELNPPELVMKTARADDAALTSPAYEISDVALYMPKITYMDSELDNEFRAMLMRGDVNFHGTTSYILRRTITTGDNQTLDFNLNNKKSVKSLLCVLKRAGKTSSTTYRYITRNIFPKNLKNFRYAIDGKDKLECETTTNANGGYGFYNSITQLARCVGVSSSLSNTLPEITEDNYILETDQTDAGANLNDYPMNSFVMPLDLDIYNGSDDVIKVGQTVDSVALKLTNNGTAMAINTDAISANNLTAYLIALCDVIFKISPEGYLTYEV